MRNVAAAVIESLSDYALREINALETRIVQADDHTDALLWEQAERVVSQLDGGLSQRQLATQWINARTGEPYSEQHVRFVRRVWMEGAKLTSRPPFRSLYNAIANRTANQRTCRTTSNPEWYTPPDYIEAARAVLGAIDLDPASCETANAVVQATHFYTTETDALLHPWRGRVWLNPPYAIDLIPQFVAKFAAHVRAGDIAAGIVLTNNCTDTAWFATLAAVASAFCFPTGRVQFWHPEHSSSSPLVGQVLTYTGPDVTTFAARFAGLGLVLVPAARAGET